PRSWAAGLAPDEASQLGDETAQNISDVLALTWAAYDGQGVACAWAKTGVAVYVLLGAGIVEARWMFQVKCPIGSHKSNMLV
ncbi:MAG: hypothetical protein QGD90_12370, partial [Candidatus Hydrogenedentes bacterium]|nr:hypothetical protein [Candidatus Hydrogenedentota bacterium]